MNSPPKPHPRAWPLQAIEMLKKMRAEGATSTEMSDALDRTRGQVTGMIHRLKLPRAEGVEPSFNSKRHKERWDKVPTSPRSRRAPRKPTAPRPKPPPPVVLTAPTNKPVPFLKLRDFHCRAIVEGERASALFCGARKKPGTAWCPFHHHRFTDPERTERHGKASARDQRFRSDYRQ